MAASVLLTLVLGVVSPAPVGAGQDSPVQGGNRLAEIKGLYESAEYDRALAAVDRTAPAVLTGREARDIEIYEALCLLALGKKAEADGKVEGVLRAEPLYEPSSELPNRLRALVDETRSRLRPALAQSHYLAGRELFEAEKFDAAVEKFAVVLQLTDVGPDRSRELTDIRILATGFRDLSTRAIAAAKRPVSARPDAPAPPPPSEPVVAPVALLQNVPQWRTNLPAARREQRLAPLTGVLEIVITPTGTVRSAKLLARLDPLYDALLLDAARQWKYQPATQNGVPVEFVKRLEINVR